MLKHFKEYKDIPRFMNFTYNDIAKLSGTTAKSIRYTRDIALCVRMKLESWDELAFGIKKYLLNKENLCWDIDADVRRWFFIPSKNINYEIPRDIILQGKEIIIYKMIDKLNS